MKHELSQHLKAYSVLFVGLAFITILFFGAWPNRHLQRIIALTLAVFYIVWGVTTHVHTRGITRRVVWEYIGVGTLASLMLILVTV